ncbi:MAG: hypothetical protein WC246_00505 [Candidatus Paceibacterota bacterium]
MMNSFFEYFWDMVMENYRVKAPALVPMRVVRRRRKTKLMH